ncbi:MAG TPA: hypothetical protein VND93_32440, partial [Myxococcales bacterium]|nr:hypothetical protein [Myxococcales bacterium]
MRSPTHTHPRWLLACALLATAGACTLGDAALSVTVQVAPAATTTRCVKVVAVPAGAPEAATDPIPRPADKDALAVAVYQGQLPESLSVVARGYDGPDCTRLNEESVPNAVRFVRGQVTAVTLRLEGSACVRPGADAGTLCLSGVCRTDQACADAGTEFDCLNGTDDDGDGKVDCRDPDCFQLACASANQCVTSPTCQADGGCGGPLLACDAPPTFCAVAVGTCSPSNGTCTYPGDTTRSCDDTNACTSPDTCRADGGCGGTPVTCGPPPGVCFGPSTGCDPDAGCLYPVKADAGCSDGDACTFADRCAPDGGCAGTPYSCSDTECTTGSACTGDGGCTSAPRTGQLCTGGVCTDAGSCLTFPYTPSNFDPVVVAAAGIGGPVTLNCNAWFNSTDGGRSWCSGQPFPVMSAVTQSGGPDAVVLAMSGLTVSSGGSLALVGSRPVILA